MGIIKVGSSVNPILRGCSGGGDGWNIANDIGFLVGSPGENGISVLD